jgi:ABC-type multidrug transport system fused ATPase/permease subunit
VPLGVVVGFLDGEEVENNGPATTTPSHTPPEPHTDGPVFAHVTEASQAGIRMKGAQFSYGTGNASATTSAAESSSGRLLNCTLSVRPGELVAVVGSLGSGKSSLVRTHKTRNTEIDR